MFENLLVAQLRKYVNSQITVAVGEELITGTLLSVDQGVLTIGESTDGYEREAQTRVIVTSQLSYVQMPVA